MLKLLVLFIGSMVLATGAIGAEGHKMSGHKAGITKTKTAQKNCPVMGGKINPKLYYQYKGQKIYVCCPGCIATIKKNPEMYLKKVQKEIAAAKKKVAPKAAAKTTKSHCPM